MTARIVSLHSAEACDARVSGTASERLALVATLSALASCGYVSHVRELPMAIKWRLHHPLPGDLFQQFAAAVA